MEIIKQQIAEIQTLWTEVYAAMRANPTAWQADLPGFFAEQIDEVVSTITVWLGKVETPNGFKPSFDLAKGLVATSLPQLLSAVKSLQKGEYKYLPTFVSGLNQILSALHSMVVFSSKNDAKNITADLSAQLSEALALLGTAQGELRQKLDLLTASSNIAKETETRATAIKELESKTANLLETTTKDFAKLSTDTGIQAAKLIADTNTSASALFTELKAATTKATAEIDLKLTNLATKTETSATGLIEGLETRTAETVKEIGVFRESAEKVAGEITADAAECAELKTEINELLKQNEGLNSTLGLQTLTLTSLQDKSKAQAKIITELLPKGASAGLAAAFEARASKLETTKWIWMAIFILSIVGLVSLTLWHGVPADNLPATDMWKDFLRRLPFAAPLIWLGWFSAIQYGNTIRVQEDYAFKAATSKAFAGYKDHMEYMATVQLDEANNAMKLLAAKTIEILAHEPLRIYQKPHKDVSPTNSILQFFSPKKPPGTEG